MHRRVGWSRRRWKAPDLRRDKAHPLSTWGWGRWNGVNPLVRRGQLSRLLHGHLGVAALDSAGTGLGAKHHRAAALALVASSELVRHWKSPLCSRMLAAPMQKGAIRRNRLLLVHRYAATVDLALFRAPRYDELRSALRAGIPLSGFGSHVNTSLSIDSEDYSHVSVGSQRLASPRMYPTSSAAVR